MRRGVRFFGFFHLACRGYVYVGRVRNLFSKTLQGVRFLVDGYVYKGPNSTVPRNAKTTVRDVDMCERNFFKFGRGRLGLV